MLVSEENKKKGDKIVDKIKCPFCGSDMNLTAQGRSSLGLTDVYIYECTSCFTIVEHREDVEEG